MIADRANYAEEIYSTYFHSSNVVSLWNIRCDYVRCDTCMVKIGEVDIFYIPFRLSYSFFSARNRVELAGSSEELRM